jgi:CRISPR/Cas system-associated endoribonuclease Cas2
MGGRNKEYVEHAPSTPCNITHKHGARYVQESIFASVVTTLVTLIEDLCLEVESIPKASKIAKKFSAICGGWNSVRE